MLREPKSIVLSLVIIGGLLPGCTTIGIKNGVPYFSKQEQWEPADDEEDKWAYVGKSARGNRKLEDENDPLNGVLMSKEAQSIERNLGYK